MKYLWKFINRFCQESMTTAVFLTANILLFTILPMIAGVLFCMITKASPLINYLTSIMLASIYAGIIFGFFGGILYLMRNTNANSSSKKYK